MEFAGGFMYTSGALLIPMPEPSDNVAAVAKPFQLLVTKRLHVINKLKEN